MREFNRVKASFVTKSLVVFLIGVSSACVDLEERNTQEAILAFEEWSTVSNSLDSESCHAYGLIKHPETTCQEMLEHASRISSNERALISSRTLECFESVCGEFVELEIEGKDQQNRTVKEIVVLKKDNNAYKVYWYRSNSLLGAIEDRSNSRSREQDSKYQKKQDELDSAYAYLTNKIPQIYQFPPCLDVRITSSNLAGKLIARDQVTLADFDSRAEKCEGELCIGLVGKKIAGVCMGKNDER